MGIATFPASASGLSSAVKTVQRGEAVSAGNITITAVDVAKTQVTSFSTGSAVTVAATGALSAANGSTSGISTSAQSGTNTGGYWRTQGSANVGWPALTASSFPFQMPSPSTNQSEVFTWSYTGGRYGQVTVYVNEAATQTTSNISLNAQNTNGMNVALNATNISGGSTALTAATYGAYLSNSTTLVVTGPCRYEVVEYN
jgi:hypothetical protein